jgi:hypothetical protein
MRQFHILARYSDYKIAQDTRDIKLEDRKQILHLNTRVAYLSVVPSTIRTLVALPLGGSNTVNVSHRLAALPRHKLSFIFDPG